MAGVLRSHFHSDEEVHCVDDRDVLLVVDLVALPWRWPMSHDRRLEVEGVVVQDLVGRGVQVARGDLGCFDAQNGVLGHDEMLVACVQHVVVTYHSTSLTCYVDGQYLRRFDTCQAS